MEKIINKENDWDQMAYDGVVFRPIQRINGLEMNDSVKKVKLGQADVLSEVNTKVVDGIVLECSKW